MICYKITNKINNKSYIGITINFDRRIKQHQRNNTNSLIHQAMCKYGINNFICTIIAENLSVEEAENLEIQQIKELNTLAPNGYNLAKGGLYGGTKYKITDEQVFYIKSHRNLPMYVLYDEFSEVISYAYFKRIYRNMERTDIAPTVDEYPYNLEFSSQFTRSKMTYADIVDIREAYAAMIDWQQVYPKYKDKVSRATFFDIYHGVRFKLIMPEVFSDSNKKKHSSLSHSGTKNANAKLTEKEVRQIRSLYQVSNKTVKEISKLYPQISTATVSDIVRYKTWKNI